MQPKKQDLNNNIWKIYLHEILAGMFFSIPILVLFWQDNGLSLTEIMSNNFNFRSNNFNIS